MARASGGQPLHTLINARKLIWAELMMAPPSFSSCPCHLSNPADSAQTDAHNSRVSMACGHLSHLVGEPALLAVGLSPQIPPE